MVISILLIKYPKSLPFLLLHPLSQQKWLLKIPISSRFALIFYPFIVTAKWFEFELFNVMFFLILNLHSRVFFSSFYWNICSYFVWGNFGVVLYLVENGQNKKFRAVSFVCLFSFFPPFLKNSSFHAVVFKFQTLLTFNYTCLSPSFTAKLGGNFNENLPKCTSIARNLQVGSY